jgi:hypothetical protein
MDQDKFHRATHPEDPFFSPPILTYDWKESHREPGQAYPIDQTHIHALQSEYFREHTNSDTCRIVEFTEHSPYSFSFRLETQASVGVISVPFAIRIATDAIINAVIKAIGKQVNDENVWGTKGAFNYDEPIETGKLIRGTVSLSPISANASVKQRVISVVTLDGERFKMTSEVLV